MILAREVTLKALGVESDGDGCAETRFHKIKERADVNEETSGGNESGLFFEELQH